MVVIMATMKAKAGKEDELISVMKELVSAVRANEKDTLDYAFHRSQKDPALFMVYEKYKTQDAVQAHMAAPHFQAAAKKLSDLLEGQLMIEAYEVME